MEGKCIYGFFFMKDGEKRFFYVGRSKNLPRRLRELFPILMYYVDQGRAPQIIRTFSKEGKHFPKFHLQYVVL